MERDVKALAVLLAVAGVGHFVRPEPFERIVPRPLPYKRGLVYASGAVEVASAALLVRSDTRRAGGLLAAGLLIGVFPANVQMTLSAVRSSRTPMWFTAGTLLRLPLQAPMIRTAVRAARG